MALPKRSIAAAENAVTVEANDAAGGMVVFQFEGTWVGTIAFEGRVGGATTWRSLQGTQIDGSNVTQITANQTVRVIADGIEVRARASAWTSGTADVYPAVRNL